MRTTAILAQLIIYALLPKEENKKVEINPDPAS